MPETDPNADRHDSEYRELRDKGYAPEIARELSADGEDPAKRPDEHPPYDARTTEELRELAQELGVVQQQDMNRPELIAALRQIK